MQAALIWIVVVVGPDFIVPARWAPLEFPDHGQCDQWLNETSRNRALNLRLGVRAECQPLDSARSDIEE